MSVVICTCGRWVSVPDSSQEFRCPNCGRPISESKTVAVATMNPEEAAEKAAEKAALAAETPPSDEAASSRPAEKVRPSGSGRPAGSQGKSPEKAAGEKAAGEKATGEKAAAKSSEGKSSVGNSATKTALPETAEENIVGRMFEALLDPRAIQWLLSLGGALSIAGLIIWLVSKGVFDSPLTQAFALGAGTFALLGGGWALTLRTRHQLAGVALTFLACAVAPLNLWFWQAQNLVVVDGHLWIGALGCSVLYAATILALRNPVFLYAFQAGISLTILLLLGDLHQFNVTWIGLIFTAVGAVLVHADRLLPQGEGTLDSRQFGPPLIWTGLVQLACGLAAVLLGQAYGWSNLDLAAFHLQPLAELLRIEPLLAAGLWLTGAYACFYTAPVPRKGGWLILPAAVSFLMAEITLLVLVKAPAEAVIVVLAATAAVAGLIAGRLSDRSPVAPKLARIATVLLSLLPVGLGYVLFVRGTAPWLEAWNAVRPLTYSLAGAMAATFGCLTVASFALKRHDSERTGIKFLAATSLIVALSTVIRLTDVGLAPARAALVLLVPLGYLAVGFFRGDRNRMQVANWLLLLLGLHSVLASKGAVLATIEPRAGALATLMWAAVGLQLTAILLLEGASWEARKRLNPANLFGVLAAGGLGLFGIELLGYFDLMRLTSVLLVGLGIAVTIAARLQSADSRFTNTFAACGTALVTVTAAGYLAVGSVMLFFGGSVKWGMLGRVAAVGLGSLIMIPLTRSNVRTVFKAFAAGSAALAVGMMVSLAQLSAWQLFEALVTALGVLLLIGGHAARFRERAGEEQDLLVDVALWLGSVLAVLPLSIAVLLHRFGGHQSIGDELALLTISLTMLATGVVWRLRGTTLIGGFALLGYLALLIGSVITRREVTMGAVLGISGASIFLIGLGLSIYRDRLLSLPDRIHRREGVFQMLDWR